MPPPPYQTYMSLSDLKCSHSILEPAPQGMGAPQATENTQGNDAEAHSGLPGRSRSSPRIHILPATMVSFRLFSTRSDPCGGLRRGQRLRNPA